MALQELFRNEAIEAQRVQSLGSVHLAVPLSFFWLTLLAASLAAVVVLIMVFGRYTRYQRVSGQLVPSAGLLGVRSPTQGTVARVYVHQGETVRRGAPLVEISDVRSSATLGSTQALISTQLRAEAARLRRELVDERQSTKEEANGLRTKLRMLDKQRIQTARQIVLEHQQLTSAESVLARMRGLAKKGYVSAIQTEQQDASVLQMQQEVGSLTSQELTTRQQIAAAQQQLQELPLILSAKQDATQQALSQNDQQFAQNEVQQDAVLRAPTNGVVSTLLVKRGQSVATEQPLLSVLPSGSVLQAQLLVPSSAVGFVRPGNQVVMRYQAFPYQEFGQQYGNVASVSRSALSNDEATALTGSHSQQPVYRVLVNLKRQSIDAYGRTNPLRPGMVISADILLNRRSLWQWVFTPLSGLRQAARNGTDQS